MGKSPYIVGLAESMGRVFSERMSRNKSLARVRVKVRRALQSGMTPIQIARKLHLPLLLIAEIVLWEATLRQAGARGLDFS